MMPCAGYRVVRSLEYELAPADIPIAKAVQALLESV
jgi:hypothetical protein